MKNTIQKMDSLDFLKSQKSNDVDILFQDPPYALGSEIIIKENGKPDYSKASDFMNKWDMPTGEWWESWFTEAYRTLKYGGYCIMFGMDRQLLLFKYYAHAAGFTEKQSMYWFFISNFPKASDLSKNIDKNAGADREVVGKSNRHGGGVKGAGTSYEVSPVIPDITAPSTPLAKKYNGYKYSIAPLKQTNETIMVFQKPYKTGSCLHDTLEMEEGNEEITCGAVNIDGNRVEITEKNKDKRVGTKVKRGDSKGLSDNDSIWGGNKGINKIGVQMYKEGGRYPSQTYCNTEASKVLDEQSGVSGGGKYKKTGNRIGGNSENSVGINGKKEAPDNYGDTGGCSKILHKCDYEKDEHDLYHYVPKVSKKERNAGCEEMEEKERVFNGTSDKSSKDIKDVEKRFTTSPTANNHPTLKPIALNERILRLFKTPNDQKILYPFAGSGSEVIGGIKAGFNNWEGCELSEEHVKIAEARIKYWSDREKEKLF